MNILIADDSADDVFLLQRAFKKAGVISRLQVVSDGLQALAYLKGENAFADRATNPIPDLLLLDLNMPCMNGFEVLEWIRQDSHCSRLIVHVLTASARESDVERAYELGANGFIVKPTRIDELVFFVQALHGWHRFISFSRQPNTIPVLA